MICKPRVKIIKKFKGSLCVCFKYVHAKICIEHRCTPYLLLCSLPKKFLLISFFIIQSTVEHRLLEIDCYIRLTARMTACSIEVYHCLIVLLKCIVPFYNVQWTREGFLAILLPSMCDASR